MTLSLKQHAVFVQRTLDSYYALKRRAREVGQFIDFRLEDLRIFILNNLGDRHCHYCRGPVTVDSFWLDHKVPPTRGGSYAFHNLAVTCKKCNSAKGDLDYIEFKELMGLLGSWSPFVRKYLLNRLQTDAAVSERLDFPRMQPSYEIEERADAVQGT